jgi:hypothetical protein
MIKSFYLFLLLLAPNYVYAQFEDYVFLSTPEFYWSTDGNEPRSDLPKICANISYNYFDELKKMKQLKEKLNDILNEPISDIQVIELENIKLKILEVNSRLKFLANPDWNKEVLNLKIQWVLPKSINPEMTPIHSYRILGANYLNQQDASVIDYFFFWFDYGIFVYHKDFYYFHYTKKTTYLEACQFISSLTFQVEIQFEMKHFAPVSIPRSKKLFLEVRAL